MIDATNLKSPGWQRIVAELSAAAPDDRVFLDRLLRSLAHVSAARQALLFVPFVEGDKPPDVRPVAMFPGAGEKGGTGAPEASAVLASTEVKRAALAALESNQSRAFTLEKTDKVDALYGENAAEGYVLALPLGGTAGAPGTPAAPASAVVTLLIEPRSKQAVQSTLAMAEVLTGYVVTHSLRQELKRNTTQSLSLQIATQLIASINSAPNFKGAGLQLTNELARHFKCDRAAIGLVRADAVRVEFLSDTEQFDRRMAMVQKLQAAMDECLDQEQPVMHPAPPADTDVLLSQAITHAHRELAASDAGLQVVSVPLRDGDEIVGVLLLEARATKGAAFDSRSVELLQATMDLVTPVLKVRRSDDRHLPARAGQSAINAGKWVVGARNTGWKIAGVAVLATCLFVTFFHTTYRIGAVAEIQPVTRRYITAPFEGILRAVPVGIEPGTRVEAGQVLAELDTVDLILQREEAAARLDQAEKAASAGMKDGKTAEVQKALATAEGARATRDLYQSRIDRSRIVAPIAGTIIAGQLKDKLGASLKTGDELFQIAPLDDLDAVARVDESDIGLIAEGGGGLIATRARPDLDFPVTIQRIVPLAEPREGKNQFQVRVKLDRPAAWMRPGMEGVVKLDAGERSLLWIGSRRVIDAVRLWLW